MTYEIYTDGACSGNPGNGGYAFVILHDGAPLVVSGSRKDTTNNQMELMAIVRGIKHVAKGSTNARFQVTVYSDSAYCINSITQGWVRSWELNGWKTKSNNPVKNQTLWKSYLALVRKYPGMKVKFVKVKGHSGDKYNEMVDKAAKNAVRT